MELESTNDYGLDLEIVDEDMDLEFVDDTESVEPHSALLTMLPENYNEDYLIESKRLPEKTPVETDLATEYARHRQFSYRGRSVQKHRPRNKVNPVSGLLRMLNRSLVRPAGVNEIVRINPKYNIVLENKNGEKQNGNATATEDVDVALSQSQKGSSTNTHYVLREDSSEKSAKSSSNLRKDPCNSNVYPLRFSTLKPVLMKNVEEKWSGCPIVPVRDAKKNSINFFDISSWLAGEVTTNHYLNDKDCRVIVLVGVLLSSKPFRETYTKKICENSRVLYLPTRLQPVEAKKIMYLSDWKGRSGLRLFPSPNCGLNSDEVVSGIPCAVKGFSIPGNGFVVADIVWSTPAPCVWPTLSDNSQADMVFVSGLQFSALQYESVETDMISDYLIGLSGSPDEQLHHMRPKTKVFFIGNSFTTPNHGVLSDSQAREIVAATELLDSFLDKIAETMEVFLIPGEADATETLLPQSPFKPIMFPSLSQRSTASVLHNPCRLKLKLPQKDSQDAILDVVLSSGSNIEEVKKYPGEESCLLIGENMLKWGHLNPAAPDFFPVEKSPEKDILALVDSLPHLYIIGNQPEFGIRRYNNTQIISLPSFAKTHQVVTLQASCDSYRILPLEFHVLLEHL